MTTDVQINGGGQPSHNGGGVIAPSVDDEAYAPTYAEAFPPLPIPGEGEGVPEEDVTSGGVTTAQWGPPSHKMSLRSSVVTQVFSVPLEERKFKEISEQQFGERPGRNQAKICVDIMAKTGVAIEMSLSKDQSLAFVITGKSDSVLLARKLVVQQLQTQASVQLKIPKDHHRFVLGPKAKRLGELELQTATKISIPRQDDLSEEIVITGTKEGIEKARHEILLISDEQAKLAFIRMPIPKIFHAFILGPNGQTLKEIVESTGARINIPPVSVMKDELTIAGEKEGVLRAEQAINAIWMSKKLIKTVAVEVKKSQHKYIIGPKGVNLGEILAHTGVAVEVPPLDSPSETITLRGDPDKLGIALTEVYAKANSVLIQDVQVPGWLHKFIIGPKGASIREINQQFTRVHIEFNDEQEKITLEGPPEEVEKATAAIVAKRQDLLSRMAFVDLKVDPKYHRHIIGRAGANVGRIKQETGVSIRIPPDESKSNIIRIEGSPEGVAKAKRELIDMVEKFDNERTKDILIDQRFHKAIIGAQGSNIKEIRDKFNQVQISFPDSSKQSDVVSLRGPKEDLDKCYKHLQHLAQEMSASSHKAEVHIFKEVIRNVIGKGGAKIRQIREETDTKIDLPKENSDSDVITITGKKENVEKAKTLIENIQKELANIKEIAVEIPQEYHTSLIGAKGRLIRSIMDECGGVLIRFPSENSKSNKVMIRGPKDDVDKAQAQLLELANERKESSFTAEVRAKPELHGFLIGRKGSSIKVVREQTGARVIFPSSSDPDQELITIVGKQDAVEKARKDLEAKISELANIVEVEINIDPKHHRYFTSRRAEALQQIARDCGGVSASFPRAASNSSKVVLKGAKDCIEAAKKRFEEIITDIENQITIEFIVPAKLHGNIMGSKGHRIQEITKEHNVQVKFPDRKNNEESAVVENGHKESSDNGEAAEGGEESTVGGGDKSPASPPRADVILITGLKDNCKAAKEAMRALLPITLEVEVPYDLHGQIIGQKGKDVRQMMEDHDVNISIPALDLHSDVIKVTGPPAKVESARLALKKRVEELEEERKQRELRSFRLEVTVPAKHHTKIIGRKGVEVSKIRQAHDVQIIFPSRDSEQVDVIIIVGLEENTHKAKDDLLSKVQEMEEMISEEVRIDPRVHPRIIGAKGRSIIKLMDDYKVDIKFPGRDAEENDLIVITGAEENVFDCRDQLLNMEEEYLQEAAEREEEYRPPPSSRTLDSAAGGLSFSSGGAPVNTAPAKGFVVRDAPWTLTNTVEEYPDLGAAAAKPATAAWPVRR